MHIYRTLNFTVLTNIVKRALKNFWVLPNASNAASPHLIVNAQEVRPQGLDTAPYRYRDLPYYHLGS